MYHDENGYCQRFAKPVSPPRRVDCRGRTSGDHEGGEIVCPPHACDARQNAQLVKPDIMARLKKTWGDRIFSAKEVAAMRAAEFEDEEG